MAYQQCLVVLNFFFLHLWTPAELDVMTQPGCGCHCWCDTDQTRHVSDGSIDNLLTITESYTQHPYTSRTSPGLKKLISAAAHAAAAATTAWQLRNGFRLLSLIRDMMSNNEGRRIF